MRSVRWAALVATTTALAAADARWPEAMDDALLWYLPHLKRLHDAVMQKIDARDASFAAAAQITGADGPGLGLMERQRLKLWLSRAYAQLAKAEP